jgi:hypothetical protein
MQTCECTPAPCRGIPGNRSSTRGVPAAERPTLTLRDTFGSQNRHAIVHLLLLCCLLGALATACGGGRPVVVGDAGRDVPADVVVDAPLTCGTGETLCADRCVNTATDRAHCGACGTTCGSGQICTAGRCEFSCPASQTLCGALCVTLASDRLNCGACGRTCAPTQRCSGGTCL